ncbi:MAG: hypothetical protein P1U56_09560 [Saprospiraceae bacterium]|nr:hypothetical protein [Saprospiraceae bacterium]
MRQQLILFVLFTNIAFGQIQQEQVIDYRLTGNMEMNFKTTKIAEGNFQIRMIPSDLNTSFIFKIKNQNRPEYSLTLHKETLKAYNNYSCVLPEGNYTFVLETRNKHFSIHINQFISSPIVSPRSQCGDTDDRVLSNDPKSGRKRVGSLCTAQLLSNGLLAMSGHCVTDDGTYNLSTNAFIEFNVPLSNNDGSLNLALPEDQYPMNIASVQWEDYATSSCGREWTLFQVNNNAETGLSPFEAQEDFYYLTNLSPNTSQNIQIVGYGRDTMNSSQLNRNFVQQSHNGPNNGVEELSNGGVLIKYETDTEGGNSGSAIQRMGNLEFTYGIHNNGGCDGGGCTADDENAGISFQYDNLENAINTFYGNNTVHVSNVSNSIFETGTAFQPYDTIEEGQNASTSGSENTVVLMTGTYNAANNYLLTKPMLIISPAGSSVVK